MSWPDTRGFTLAEVLVVLTVGSILSIGLQQVYLTHRRFVDWQSRVVAANDAFRVAGSVLSADLREAMPASGDIELSANDRLVVRAPVGLAFVCATEPMTASIALHRVLGRMPQYASDSVLIYATTGWAVTEIVTSETPGQGGLSCGGTTPEAQLRLPVGSTDAVPVGAPVRVFHRRTYHLAMNGGDPWLARTDPSGTEPLVGPLSVGGLRFRLLDEAGVETVDPDLIAGVEFRMILPPRTIPGTAAVPDDTATTVLQVRNR